jgi:hypothetical protein
MFQRERVVVVVELDYGSEVHSSRKLLVMKLHTVFHQTTCKSLISQGNVKEDGIHRSFHIKGKGKIIPVL